MAKQKRAPKPKLPFGITEEFVDQIDTSTTEQLKGIIVQIQGDLDEASNFLKTNEEIIRLKGELDMIKGPTNETKRSLTNRTKFIVDALKEKGAL